MGSVIGWPANADYKMWRSLRTVRELHKAEEGDDRFGVRRRCCIHCSALAGQLVDSPCPTVVATMEVDYDYPY